MATRGTSPRHDQRTFSPVSDRTPVAVTRVAPLPNTASNALDEIAEETFDCLTRTVAAALRVPMVAVILLIDGQLVVKGSMGFGGRSKIWRQFRPARDLCRRAVDEGHPVVSTEPAEEALSYVFVPLVAGEDDTVGVVCAMDAAPRAWTTDELSLLTDLAAPLVTEIELRREMAERRESQEMLLHTTLHDALTGLPNRTLFMERLRHAVLRARRHPEFLFAVLFLDLDRFKVINDSLGHAAGDALLIGVAERLKSATRPEDTVARLGGDEFAVLLEGIASPSDAGRVAKRIQAGLASSIDLGGYEVFTSVSVGIVLSSALDATPELMVRNADMAMYRAKARGGAGYQMFDRQMHASALARLQLETDLRHAMERNEFRLDYQPIVSLETGRVAGLEALIRWHHPERGLVPPNDFIPVAEETGLIVRLGRWVLTEACRHIAEWRRTAPAGFSSGSEPLAVSVNLSARQFAEPDLAQQIATVLRETGTDPSWLWLEITETVVVENAALAISLLGQIKALGVRVHMDDFGTGYSSLSYLHQLPLDAIKIDRAFVGQMDDENGKDYQFVRTILTLAQSVGMRTVAEGVVSRGQLTALRALGCAYGQGYLFSAPMGWEDVPALLAADPAW